MKKAVVVLSLLVALFVALVQLEVLAGPFDSLSPRAEAGAVSPQVSFSGDLRVGGLVDAQAGIRFPDGSVQLSAAAGAATDLTANAGLYNNRIVEFSPPAAYTEVCFKGGEVHFDLHTFGESTAGGSCVPGDVGWVIERDERSAQRWEDARVTCLLEGMRLPEPFELKFSCLRDGLMGLNDIAEEGTEWASNTARSLLNEFHKVGVGVPNIGGTSCNTWGPGWLAVDNSIDTSNNYRCVR